MARRRQRYTVTFQDLAEPLVIMAYSPEGAATVARQVTRYRQVVSVQKGDYRLKLNPAAGWKLDEQAFQAATALLGLRWPAVVQTNSREGRTAGNYSLKLGQEAPARLQHLRSQPYYHKIMVKSYLAPSEANETLWHELIHAVQAERAGNRLEWVAYLRRQYCNWNYSDRPMEVEAHERSAELGTKTLLTRPLHAV